MINQQKIYIDVDEEITTVIDHIYRAKGNDIVLVVPQRALLLQSVVNLRLLQREAKKYKKNIILMTRDEDGIAFAKRAGITIQPFVIEEDEDEIETATLSTQIEKKPVPKYAPKNMKEKPHQTTNMSMGSQSFFGNGGARGVSVAGIHASQQSTNRTVKQEPQINTRQQIQKKRNVYSGNDAIPQKCQEEHQVKHRLWEQGEGVENFDEYEQSLRSAQLSNGIMGNANLPQNKSSQFAYVQDKKSRKSQHNITQKSQKLKKHNNVDLSAMTGTVVKGFIFGGIVLVIFILFIVVLPKTKISVNPKHINIDEKLELTAQTDQSAYDSERRLLPARLIERDITFTKTFDATGSGDVKAQKAQGKIIIINEYNDKPQPLVATTRFLAQDGTLFRLVNQTIVPGMRDGEAGKVEALVVADSEGGDSNIGPTKFSIPGFEGSPKEGKFYAISEEAMTGGGIGGKGVAVVTEDDIERAKNEMIDELMQYMMEQITGLLRPDNEVLIDKNIAHEIIRSEASVSAGTMAEQFMYEIVVHVKVLVFSEDDVLAIMESNLVEKYHQYNAEQVEVQIKYEDVVSDFDKESIKMTAHGVADVVTTVDVTSFKEDITGKKHEELLKIMEDDYGTEIEKIVIESVFPGFPVFIANRVSRFGFMTDVSVKQ